MNWWEGSLDRNSWVPLVYMGFSNVLGLGVVCGMRWVACLLVCLQTRYPEKVHGKSSTVACSGINLRNRREGSHDR